MRCAAIWSETSGLSSAWRKDVAAAEVDLAVEGESHRDAGIGAQEIALHRHDPRDPRRLPGARHDHGVTRLDAAAGNRAGIAAEALVRPVDPLDGKAERPADVAVRDLDGLEEFEERRSLIPGGLRAPLDDIVAEAGGHRDRRDAGEIERRGELGEIADDVLETVAVEVDEVDLVDREHDVADAEERHDVGVPAGLGEDAGARVDEEDGEIGGRSAGRHVAGVLLVAGRVGDDEPAPVGGEIAVGDVDGDALLALGDETVDEEGEIDLAAGGAPLLRIGFERGELILEQALGVVQKPPDQRRLAVVDAAAGEKAEQALAFVDGKERGKGLGFGETMGHQK